MSEPIERRDVRIVHCTTSLFPAPFVNAIGIPCVEIRRDKESGYKRSWPINHPRIRAMIAAEVFRRVGLVCLDKEISRVINILAGNAWDNPREDLDGEMALDENPLIEAIHVLMLQPECSGHVEGTCSKLLSQLNKIARRHQLDRKSTSWPKTASHLSKSIQDHSRDLERLGIRSEKGRRPGGERYVKLIHQRLCDDAGEKASQLVSINKSHHPKGIQRPDAPDGENFILRQIESKDQNNGG